MTRTRRRVLDAAVVVGVALVGTAAAVQPFVGTSSRSSAEREGRAAFRINGAARARLEARLRQENLRGTLVVADARCRLAALPLPSLRPVRDLEVQACTAAVSPHSPAASGWFVSPEPPYLFARCVGRGIEVETPHGPSVRFVRGCAPAWRPDGTLTYVRRGEVAHFPHSGRARVALATYQLDRAFGASRRPRVRAIDWASDDRAAGLVELARPAAVVLAFFEDGELRGSRKVVAGARALAARPGAHDVLVLDRASRSAVLYADGAPPRSVGKPVADASWSPDGRWLAVVRAGRVELADARGGARIRLGLEARAVAWR